MTVRWKAVVAESQMSRIDEVAQELQAAGMHVDAVLEVLGAVLGSAEDRLKAGLSAAPGVASVSPQCDVRASRA